MVDFKSINESSALFNWPTEPEGRENMYEWAIHYLDLDWNIMPIESSGKKPRLYKWEQYQNERVTPELAEEWWDFNWPLANIALICGQISNIVVMDIDDISIVNMGITFEHRIPETAMSKTSRGLHLFFKYPRGGKFPSFKGQGFDLQSDGKYVIIPPSVHPTGAIYSWLIDPWYELEPFAELPEFILDLSRAFQGEVSRKGEVTPLTNMDSYFAGVGEGERNNAAARLAGYLFNKDREYDEVFCTMMGWNFKNKPPLSNRELITVIDSVFKKHLRSLKNS